MFVVLNIHSERGPRMIAFPASSLTEALCMKNLKGAKSTFEEGRALISFQILSVSLHLEEDTHSLSNAIELFESFNVFTKKFGGLLEFA